MGMPGFNPVKEIEKVRVVADGCRPFFLKGLKWIF